MVTYAADTFNRADTTGAPGATDTGNFTWVEYAGYSTTPKTAPLNWSIFSNRVITSTNVPVDTILVADDGQGDGTLSMTWFGGDSGLVFRAATGAAWWMVWVSATTTKLMKYNAGYTTVATAATQG